MTPQPQSPVTQGFFASFALRSCAWAERWFPDAYVFAALAIVVVAVIAVVAGASPAAAANAFGDGFWTLIPFTMQMVFVLVGGYVVASSPPILKLTNRLALWPRSGRGAVCLVAVISMLASLLHWGVSVVLSGLLVRALGRRADLNMDYRAAGAAAYLGLGTVWAMGLSSSAAQLQANPASMSPALLAITGVIPFTETIFLWQSMLMTAVIIAVSAFIAWRSAPTGEAALTAAKLQVMVPDDEPAATPTAPRPAEWLERSPLLNLLLNWRPRRFLDAVTRIVPATAGILIQFPLYGGIAAILTGAKDGAGHSLAQHLSGFFARIATGETFPLVMGAYSAVLGFVVPSGGGKWIVEAPYVMQAANELHVHLGWAVQVYNAAEAMPNLINPMWMLPLLGIIGLKARDLIGFSFVQLLVHVPLVLFLLWALGLTLVYHPPVMPG
jgi:short-chain fatty acids transporter